MNRFRTFSGVSIVDFEQQIPAGVFLKFIRMKDMKISKSRVAQWIHTDQRHEDKQVKSGSVG